MEVVLGTTLALQVRLPLNWPRRPTAGMSESYREQRSHSQKASSLSLPAPIHLSAAVEIISVT